MNGLAKHYCEEIDCDLCASLKNMKKVFEVKGTALTFEFDNEEALNHFKTWLCESGEQQYWEWQEAREDEEAGAITGLSFDYWNGAIIKVKCGRLDDDEE